PALRRDNVALVTERIERITPRGLVTADGCEHEVDAIICGTGFRVSDYLSPITIVGTGGVTLHDPWRASLRHYPRVSVPRFPNMMMMVGPNTALGHNSMIFMIEAQARYARRAIEAMRDRKLASIDVRPGVEEAFRAELAARMKRTVWTSGCKSWYQNAHGEV